MQLFYWMMVQAPSAQGLLLKRFGSVHPCRPPGLLTVKARPSPVPSFTPLAFEKLIHRTDWNLARSMHDTHVVDDDR